MRTAASWAVAAALAGGLAYQSFIVLPALREAAGAQAVAPVFLTRGTRGAAPIVTAADPASYVSLALDLEAETSNPAALRYQVRRADGTEVAAGDAPVPPPGTPLVILVPARDLTPRGEFLLSIGDAAGLDATAVDYRFAVAETIDK